MSDEDDRLAPLARAWDEAATGYERYFVPRFAPWVELAVSELTEPLPPGALAVPCCGTFPELPALAAAHPDREIVGIDLSAGMVRLARRRAERLAQVRVVEGDATTLRRSCPNGCAGVVSVFGLQQLPDPEGALSDWVTSLSPGGRLSVVYWPATLEDDGPFALLDRVLSRHRPAAADDSWQDRLAAVVSEADATVVRDEYVSFPMLHPDAATFWDAMTEAGPLRALANARGAAFVRAARAEFLGSAPAGPWRHRPRARHLVAYRGDGTLASVTSATTQRDIVTSRTYGSAEAVVVRVRRRGAKLTIDDAGAAVRLAGRTAGWHERAERIVADAGVNVNRRGVVFVPAVGEAQVDRLVALVADTSLEVYDALLDQR